MSEGYEKLKNSVIKDCVSGCFNENGCNKLTSNCMHKYCDKFKWIIDRAKQYSEKLNIDYLLIINLWEKYRDYWYMNYYQDANQPEITSDKCRVFDTVDDFVKSVGDAGFRCPVCKDISQSPYKCTAGNKCNWKSYGIFGCLDKGVFVFCKDKLKGESIFMPIVWENNTVVKIKRCKGKNNVNYCKTTKTVPA